MSSNLTLAQIKEQKEKEGKGSRQPCKEDKGLTDNRFVKIAKKNSLQTFERECKYPNKNNQLDEKRIMDSLESHLDVPFPIWVQKQGTEAVSQEGE